jgi:glycosyltransferase involved in cell wall biosynthesis
MNVAISTTRPFHAPLLANALISHGAVVTMYSSATRRFFRRMDPSVRMRLVPSVLQTGMHLLRWRLSPNLLHLDSALYDHSTALLLNPGDMFIGWATAAFASGRKAKARGSQFVLDRACPHVDFQQSVVSGEAERTGAVDGVAWQPEPAWFHDRQLAEYQEADVILVPSEYTRRTFPAELHSKIIKAPLLGRCRFPADVSYERNSTFTVGAVGGQPLRKGYLYLLQAWQALALPNAKLLIRSDFTGYPVLEELVRSQSSIEMVQYVPDIDDFYRRCDAFVLPSVDDGFGMALFEAMAHGLPCVATTNCGSSELLTNGHDSLIVEPFSAEQLAQALLSLYESEEFRQIIARNGRKSISRMVVGESSPLYSAAIGQLLAGHEKWLASEGNLAAIRRQKISRTSST